MNKKILVPLFVLVLSILACGTPAPVTPTVTNAPAATVNPSELWYLIRGDSKSDQAWGVDVDTQGNIYLAAYEQKTDQWFTDMAIYKFSPDGTQLWRTEWGGQFQEKAFIAAVDEPFVYIAGLTHTDAGLTEADMAVLGLDTESGQILWEFTWGQGFGYEEADGLVVEEDAIYVSGWSTSEGDNYDIAVLKLDRQGNKIWESVWGTTGFDSCDGQMVITSDSIYVSGKLDADNMFFGGQAYVARFSKDTGEYLQHYTYDGGVASDGLGMTSDGESLYVTGMDYIAGEGNQLLLLKLDFDLHLLWDRHWGENVGEYVSRTAAVNDAGEIIVAANQRIPDGAPADLVFLFYSPAGELLRTSTWGGADEELVHGIVTQGRFIYLAGEIKYAQEPQNDVLLIKADALTGGFPTP
ncbi:MAG: PQQ-like beta-propeller repeat protein [Chloroflexi bacterium]|nr:PQQ-like beta-propeller repeat protein [Chloroflexota bacterium]